MQRLPGRGRGCLVWGRGATEWPRRERLGGSLVPSPPSSPCWEKQLQSQERWVGGPRSGRLGYCSRSRRGRGLLSALAGWAAEKRAKVPRTHPLLLCRTARPGPLQKALLGELLTLLECGCQTGVLVCFQSTGVWCWEGPGRRLEMNVCF